MTIILPVDTAQVTLTYTGDVFDSGGGATVLGFWSTEAWSVGRLTTLATDVRDSWLANLQDVTADNVTLAAIRAISTVVGADLVVGQSGTISTTQAPPNVSVLVNYSSEYRLRRGKGRSFFPGLVPESAINEQGVFDPGYLGPLQDAIEAFFDDIVGSEEVAQQQVILQNEEGQSPPIDQPVTVVSRNVSSKVASQRRRLRK